MIMEKTKFIAFEGIDGCGKSTQIDIFNKYLTQRMYKVYVTQEPSNAMIGNIIRQVLEGSIVVDETTLALLFTADRIEHNLSEIAVKLRDDYIVLTDRYYMSSYAYNMKSDDIDFLIKLNESNDNIIKPTCHIYIDVLPEVAIKRITMNRKKIEKYETLKQLDLVRKRYFEVFDKLKNREKIIIINGNKPKEKVFDDILKNIFIYK